MEIVIVVWTLFRRGFWAYVHLFIFPAHAILDLRPISSYI